MPKQKASSFADDLAEVQQASFADDLKAVSSDAPRIGPDKLATGEKALNHFERAGWEVLKLAKRGKDYATKKPEEFIEAAGPAGGAALGAGIGSMFAGVGALPGAALGALGGYAYGKANRAASNASTGKPLSTGMPQEASGWTEDIATGVLGNTIPEVATGPVINGLVRGGRSLIARAVAPRLSTIEHMSEMGQRGMLPQDVRNQIATTIRAEKPAHLWSPVSDEAARGMMSKTINQANANTGVVDAMTEAGKTVPMAPVYGEGGGYALSRAKAGFTPSETLGPMRARIEQFRTDPESRLTVPYERVKFEPRRPFDETPAVQGVSFESRSAGNEMIPTTRAVPGEELYSRVEFDPTVVRSRIPNPEGNPSDLLQAKRMLEGEERANWGKDVAGTARSLVNKGMIKSSGNALKELDETGTFASGLDREHKLMNALDALVYRSQLQSTARPVNLYTMLGILGGNPQAIALGIGNYPWAMAGLGNTMWNAGERLAGNRQLAGNLLRAALLSQMVGQGEK